MGHVNVERHLGHAVVSCIDIEGTGQRALGAGAEQEAQRQKVIASWDSLDSSVDVTANREPSRTPASDWIRAPSPALTFSAYEIWRNRLCTFCCFHHRDDVEETGLGRVQQRASPSW